MKRFCKECGKEAAPEHKICIHCGTPLPPLNEEPKPSEVTSNKRSSHNEQKPKMSKKKKGLLSVVGVIAVLMIGFSVWAQNYQSPESVYKRFVEAATEKDVNGLQSLVVHENGAKATKGEAQALIKLIEEEGEYALDQLFVIEPSGKFLYIFEANKAIAIDQYAYYSDPVEGLTFAFNEYEPNLRKNKMYGPLIPGMYNVLATFKGEYGETSKEGEVTLANEYGDESPIDIEVNIAEVTFHVENFEAIDAEKSHVLIDDEKVKLTDDGSTEPVGPFILDGSQKAITVATLPWGEVESEPVAISEKEISLNADLLSKEDFAAVSDLLVNFGEENAKVLANKSAKELTNVSDAVKKTMNEKIDNNLSNDDLFYTGELVQVDIDRRSAEPLGSDTGPKLTIDTQYTYKEAYHEIDEDPELSESDIIYSVVTGYDEEEESWFIENIDGNYGFSFEATDTIEGSEKLYGPSEESVKSAKDATMNEEMASFITDYTQANVKAINMADFSYVEEYIAKDGPRTKEASEYIDYLDSKNITEDYIDSEVESIKETDDKTWEVTLLESFTINKEDSSEDKDYRTKVIVKEIDGELFVHELIETNEI